MPVGEFDQHRLVIRGFAVTVDNDVAYAHVQVFSDEYEIAAQWSFGPAIFEQACGRWMRLAGMCDGPRIDKVWRDAFLKTFNEAAVFESFRAAIEIAGKNSRHGTGACLEQA